MSLALARDGGAVSETPRKKLENLELGASEQLAALRPSERLARFLTASAAGNEVQQEMLRQTCPRHDYRGPDFRYTDRVHGANAVTLVNVSELRLLAGKIHILNVLGSRLDSLLCRHRITALAAFLDGMGCAKGRPQLAAFGEEARAEGNGESKGAEPPPLEQPCGDEEESDGPEVDGRITDVEKTAELETEAVRDILTRLAEALAAEYLAYWQAFDAFSRRRLGVDADTAIRAMSPLIADETMAILALYPDVKPAAQTAEAMGEAMEETWRRRFGGGSGHG
jgi:hypothetical protein